MTAGPFLGLKFSANFSMISTLGTVLNLVVSKNMKLLVEIPKCINLEEVQIQLHKGAILKLLVSKGGLQMKWFHITHQLKHIYFPPGNGTAI